MKIRFLLFSLMSFLLFVGSPTTAMVVTPIKKKEFTINDFVNSSNKDLETKFGTDFNFKEKLGLYILKKKLKKVIKKNPNLGKTDFSSIQQAFGCSKIVLKNGDIIEADVSEITPTEIRYKRCGKANDPDIIISKNDVLSVTTEDGSVIFRNTGGKNYNPSPNGQSNDGLITEPLGIASIGAGGLGLILGLFASTPILGILGILLAIAGIILGWTSLTRIRKNPEKYKGKGLAITGIITGGVLILLIVVALFALA